MRLRRVKPREFPMLKQRPIVYLGLLAASANRVATGVSVTAMNTSRKPATTPTERVTDTRRRSGER